MVEVSSLTTISIHFRHGPFSFWICFFTMASKARSGVNSPVLEDHGTAEVLFVVIIRGTILGKTGWVDEIREAHDCSFILCFLFPKRDACPFWNCSTLTCESRLFNAIGVLKQHLWDRSCQTVLLMLFTCALAEQFWLLK